jgi:hypothetical protein
VWGSGCIDPHFLDLGTSWRWVVSFTPLPRYPRYPFDTRLGGPQSRSGRYGKVKILYPTGTRTPAPPVVQSVASRYTDWAIPAPTHRNENIKSHKICTDSTGWKCCRCLNNTIISAGIPTGYWLDCRGTGVRFPAGGILYSLHSFQTCHRTHSTSYAMHTGGFFLGSKSAGACSWAPISIYCRGQEWSSYTFTHPYGFMAW